MVDDLVDAFTRLKDAALAVLGTTTGLQTLIRRICSGEIGRLEAGFGFDRTAKGSHEIWRNVLNGHRTTVPHHPEALPEGTVRRHAKTTLRSWVAAGSRNSAPRERCDGLD